MDWARDGVCLWPHDAGVAGWVAAAGPVAEAVLARALDRPGQLRHGGTWFVGLDALPNARDGSIGGAALRGPWSKVVAPPDIWHPAQLSVVFPGYPGRDADESDAAHRYRRDRGAAHLDGLHAVGPDKRRFLREPHGFILGLPLEACSAAPLLVWPGSHRIMGDALRAAVAEDKAGRDPAAVDLTDVYVAARRQVFATITPLPVHCPPGGAILLHRHLLHGVDVWRDGQAAGAARRMIAYFRPLLPSLADWFAAD